MPKIKSSLAQLRRLVHPLLSLSLSLSPELFDLTTLRPGIRKLYHAQIHLPTGLPHRRPPPTTRKHAWKLIKECKSLEEINQGVWDDRVIPPRAKNAIRWVPPCRKCPRAITPSSIGCCCCWLVWR